MVMNFSEMVTTLQNVSKNLSEQRSKLGTELSNLDAQVNHIYHVIELLPLNAAEMSKITKKLKELLVLRRSVKEDINTVTQMMENKVGVIHTVKNKSLERKKQYTAEALSSYNRIFGKKKVLKNV